MKITTFKAKEHEEPECCQLLLAVTGTKTGIIKACERIIAECQDNYGKPRQGINSNQFGTVEIITPFWDGSKF